MTDWGREQHHCMLWAGCRFKAPAFGYVYEWEADKVIHARMGDKKPYLIARPIRRISGKRGWLRAPQVFHAENLPLFKSQ